MTKSAFEFDDAFIEHGGLQRIATYVIDKHVDRVINALTDIDQHGKELLTSLAALRDAGKQSDRVTFYNSGDGLLYKETKTSKYYLDVTVRDPNLSKILSEMVNTEYDNTGLLYPFMFKRTDDPYYFRVQESTGYNWIETYFNLKHIKFQKNGDIIITLEELRSQV